MAKKYYKKGAKESPEEKIANAIIKQIEENNIIFPTRDTQGQKIFSSSNIFINEPYKGINTLMCQVSLLDRHEDEKLCTEKYGELRGKALFSKFISFYDISNSDNGFEKDAVKGLKADTIILSPRLTSWYYKERDEDGKRIRWNGKDENNKSRSPTKQEIREFGLYSLTTQQARGVFAVSDLVKKGVDIPEKCFKAIDNEIDKIDIDYDKKEYYSKLVEAGVKTFNIKMIYEPNIEQGTGGYFIPNEKAIAIRPFEMYSDPGQFARIFFHEVGHMTGIEEYFDRESLKNYSDQKAKEELIAEFTSAMVCANYGIGTYCFGDTGELMENDKEKDVGNSGYILGYMRSIMKDKENGQKEMKNILIESQKNAKFITNEMNRFLSIENEKEPLSKEQKKEERKQKNNSLQP